MSGERHFYVNRKFLDIFGYDSVEEVVGKTLNLVVHPDDQEKAVSYNNRRQRGEAAPDRYEFKGLRKNGDVVYIEVSATTTTYQGKIISLVFMRDVTERKNLQFQLLHSQKMEAIGTLAGGVAHDFNNILTVILGLGNLLQMATRPDDCNRPYIDQIVLSSKKAAELTKSLLAFSRKQRINLEPHHLGRIVENTAKLLRRLLFEDIELELDLADEGIALLDVCQIDHLLMNLTTNARDAMPGGGLLTIKTGKTTLDKSFSKTHGFGKPGKYLHLSVSDTGIGMDERTVARIFDPFFTTKETGKGTGLGLASVYGIVKQHNGYITVTSYPLNGTTFDIYFPLVEVTPGTEPDAAEEARGGHEVILIIEDDPDVRDTIRETLSAYGYGILEAANGEDGIRIFNEHKDEINLIMLDVVMPGRNGKEVLEEINRIHPEMKVIFVSGYTGEIVLEKGVCGDKVDFLQKPPSLTEILGKVREVLDR